MKRIEEWWHLDEKHNALDYLETGVRNLLEVERNPWAWKWVCISLHGALYGFGVCAVKGTIDDSVIYTDNRGDEKLLGFDRILERCKDKTFMGPKTLVLSEEQEEAIKFMKNELRNRIEHFKPCSWSLEVHGLPEMAISYFDIIEFLAIQCENIRWEEHEISHIRALCNSGRELALGTKLHLDLYQ